MSFVRVPPAIQSNFDLQALNTLSIPARAEYFTAANSVEEIHGALDWARANDISVTVLGGGSNVVLPEKISGLVVQPKIRGVKLDGNTHIVTAGAGENWHALVAWCVDNKLYGLENLALIPGLVGGAPIQNIGAYGVELKDVFHSLQAIELSTGELKTIAAGECEFRYRDSIFKGRYRNRYIIVSVSLQLSRLASVKVEYPELKKFFPDGDAKPLTPEDVFNAVVAIRQAKLPDPARLPNAGSFFKNPVVTAKQYSVIKERYPHVVAYPQSAGEIKLAAAWLIDNLGWKGRELNGVAVHQNQALVLTNPNKLPAARLLKLAGAIQADVFNHYGIELEIEPGIL